MPEVGFELARESTETGSETLDQISLAVRGPSSPTPTPTPTVTPTTSAPLPSQLFLVPPLRFQNLQNAHRDLDLGSARPLPHLLAIMFLDAVGGAFESVELAEGEIGFEERGLVELRGGG